MTGLIDLVRQDFQGGIGRLVYVAMLVASAGVAVWAISAAFGWSVTPEYGVELTPWLHYLLRFLTSFVAAYGFAMLFIRRSACGATRSHHWCGDQHCPNRLAPAAGCARSGGRWLGSACCRSARGVCCAQDAFLARDAVRARCRHHDSRCSLVPSAHVPDNQQIDDALAALFTVMFTIVAIGMGLALSRMLTDKNWLMEKQERVPNLWEFEEENA